MGEEEVINIKLPKFLSTRKMRENPWMVSTFVLLVLFIIILFGNFFNLFGMGTQGSVSASSAGQALVTFLNQNAASNVQIANISSQNGLYLVNIIYNGSIIPLYVTTDGKYFIQTLIPLSSTASTQTNSGTPTNTATAAVQIPSFAPFLGSASAPLSLIEFGDYQCPFCGQFFSQTESQIRNNYVNTGKVKFYFLDFAFLGPDSQTLAQGAWCANDQGQYYAYHDYIYSHQQQENSGWATATKLKAMITNITGIDPQQFGSCLDSGKYSSRVQQLTQLGQSLGIQGTPGFVIQKQGSSQGTVLSGAQPYSVFQQAFNQ